MCPSVKQTVQQTNNIISKKKKQTNRIPIIYFTIFVDEIDVLRKQETIFLRISVNLLINLYIKLLSCLLLSYLYQLIQFYKNEFLFV